MEKTNVKCINCSSWNSVDLNSKLSLCTKCGKTFDTHIAYEETKQGMIAFGESIDKEQQKILKKYKIK